MKSEIDLSCCYDNKEQDCRNVCCNIGSFSRGQFSGDEKSFIADLSDDVCEGGRIYRCETGEFVNMLQLRTSLDSGLESLDQQEF